MTKHGLIPGGTVHGPELVAAEGLKKKKVPSGQLISPQKIRGVHAIVYVYF